MKMIEAKDGGYIWETRDGKVLTTKEMTTEHIKNTINYLKRVGLRYHGAIRDWDKDIVVDYYDGPNKARDKEIIKLFEEELKLRGEL